MRGDSRHHCWRLQQPKLNGKILSSAFDSFQSVSLYGEYGTDHQSGVDARDLSRYADATFSGYFGIIVYDYFVEHDAALSEAARVVEDNGLFIQHINTPRLTDGDEAPTVYRTIKKRPGYFDYVPDDAAMPSIKVGIRWFLAALDRAGFDGRILDLTDPHTGERLVWFLGRRRPRSASLTDGSAPSRPAVAPPEPASQQQSFNAVKFDCSGEEIYESPSHLFSVPVFNIPDVQRIQLDISIPPLPKSLKNCDFAEHVFDNISRISTNQVIIVGTGKVGVSYDLGQTWTRIELPGCEDVRFNLCFTTRSGKHIVQAMGWLAKGEADLAGEHHGRLFVFSPDWNLLTVSKAGDAHWHGTASIDEKNGVIMFADYFDNAAKYRRDAATSASGSMVQPCAIWRSRDDGFSWEKVFEQDPSQIRHFHTVIADPFDADVWWASSGDLASESRVWRSPDNGDTWVDWSDPDPAIDVPKAFASRKGAAHRYTDAIVREHDILWGADDLIGDSADYSPDRPIKERSGARVYRTPKTNPFQLQEIGYIGQPVRSMIDVGQGWVLTTEAKREISGRRASLFFLDAELNNIVKLVDANNFRNRGTGLTYSRSSRKSRDGVFFSYKGLFDFFDNSPRIVMYRISYANT